MALHGLTLLSVESSEHSVQPLSHGEVLILTFLLKEIVHARQCWRRWGQLWSLRFGGRRCPARFVLPTPSGVCSGGLREEARQQRLPEARQQRLPEFCHFATLRSSIVSCAHRTLATSSPARQQKSNIVETKDSWTLHWGAKVCLSALSLGSLRAVR